MAQSAHCFSRLFSASMAAPIPSQPRPLEIVLRAEGHRKLEAETEGDKVCLGVPGTEGLPRTQDLHATTEEVLGTAA